MIGGYVVKIFGEIFHREAIMKNDNNTGSDKMTHYHKLKINNKDTRQDTRKDGCVAPRSSS